MFTPPPSPLPPLEKSLDEPPPIPGPRPEEVKRQVATRTKWSILLVPAVLILITVSTRFISHPALFDALSGLPDVGTSAPDSFNWSLHKRHPYPQAADFSSTVAFPSSVPTSLDTSQTSTAGPSSATNVPTIPSNPVLPIPFPQPFDTTMSQNFSTQSCVNFYTNMTQSPSFRECRPFGLLQQSSSAFLNQAQGNVTLLNDLVWGTCNTDLDAATCTSNMNWFSGALRQQCAAEITNRNNFVEDTLNGLLVYSLMRNVGCQSNPSTNVYCYISAVMDSNPSDLYYYQLPFGITLPNNTTPSCSACTKTIMGLYLSAVIGKDPDTMDTSVRNALSKTYGAASEISVNVCGNGYVQTTTAVSNGKSGGVRTLVGSAGLSMMVGAFVFSLFI